MTVLYKPSLAIKPGPTINDAVIEVTVTVGFDPYEQTLMKQGLQYGLACFLYGEDGTLFDPQDDYLLTVGQDQILPGDRSNPSPQEVRVFSELVNTRSLWEDTHSTDEIYAAVRLTNLHEPAKFRYAKSNVIEKEFGP